MNETLWSSVENFQQIAVILVIRNLVLYAENRVIPTKLENIGEQTINTAPTAAPAI